MTPPSFGNGNKFPVLMNSLVSSVRSSALKPDLVQGRRKAGDERGCLVHWLMPFPDAKKCFLILKVSIGLRLAAALLQKSLTKPLISCFKIRSEMR